MSVSVSPVGEVFIGNQKLKIEQGLYLMMLPGKSGNEHLRLFNQNSKIPRASVQGYLYQKIEVGFPETLFKINGYESVEETGPDGKLRFSLYRGEVDPENLVITTRTKKEFNQFVSALYDEDLIEEIESDEDDEEEEYDEEEDDEEGM